MRGVGHLALSAALALSAILLLQLLAGAPLVDAASSTTPTPNAVVMNADGTMTVDGKPFKVKGIGESNRRTRVAGRQPH